MPKELNEERERFISQLIKDEERRCFIEGILPKINKLNDILSSIMRHADLYGDTHTVSACYVGREFIKEIREFIGPRKESGKEPVFLKKDVMAVVNTKKKQFQHMNEQCGGDSKYFRGCIDSMDSLIDYFNEAETKNV